MANRIEERAEELFARWLGERERGDDSTLEDVCRDHPELATHLRELARDLDAVPISAAGLGEAPPSPVPLAALDPGDDAPVPPEVPGYVIHGLLGVGGMGAVFDAEERSPHRRVALKVLHTRLTTPRLLQRFELESEALARLQHPGVAQVLRTGRTSDGSPFFAMERVEGRPITEYADAEGLGPRQRAEFLARVCDAVEHAHQRGVVHRDLKPANLLVTGEGAPKVLDFGVARLAGAEDEGSGGGTRTGEVVGTLAYMSPEQASGDVRSVDTRTDVYALGVVLYELLAGRRPYDVTDLPLGEALRRVCELDPPRLGTLDARLRGDLETIAAKALAKEPDRRYASASQLGADLRRFLRDEPIEARPASVGYQLSKFARRHRALVAGASVALLALVLGLLGTLFGLRRERDALLARDEEAAKYRVIAEHTDAILGAVAPAVAQGLDTELLRRVLEASSRTLEERSVGHPEAEAVLRRMIGTTHADLTDHALAEAHLRRSLELFREVRGPDDPETLQTELELASVLMDTDRVSEAAPLVEHVHAVRETARADEVEDRVFAINALGELRRRQGDAAAAIELYREAYALAVDRLDESATAYRTALNNYAWSLDRQGDVEESVAEHVRSLSIRLEELGPDHEDTIKAFYNLAYTLDGAGRADEARPMFASAAARGRRVFGERNPATLAMERSYAMALVEEGSPTSLEEARGILRSVLRTAEEDGLLLSMEVVGAAATLGRILAVQGHFGEAVQLVEADLARHVELFGVAAAPTLGVRSTLAAVLGDAGRHDEAIFRSSANLESAREHESSLPPYLFERVLRTHGRVLARAGRFEEARRALDEALDRLLAMPTPRQQEIARTAEALVPVLMELGESEAARYLQDQLDEARGD